MYGRRQSPLGTVISFFATSIFLMIFFMFFFPICSMIILLIVIVVPISIIAYDSAQSLPELEMTEPLFTSTEIAPVKMSKYELKGVVFGSCVKTRNLFSQARAELRSIIGGEARQFTSLMDQSKQIALNRMFKQAKKLNADGIVGLRFITAQTMTGAAEIIAYGTAIKIKG